MSKTTTPTLSYLENWSPISTNRWHLPGSAIRVSIKRLGCLTYVDLGYIGCIFIFGVILLQPEIRYHKPKMSPSATPQDEGRTSQPPSPTDSEKAQETYDEILDLLQNFQLVLRGGIEKNLRIDQAKKNEICFSINAVVTEAHRKLGSFDGTTFKERMNEKEREELLGWLLVKWDERQRDVRAALDAVAEELERDRAEFTKQLKMAREMAEKMQPRVVINELKEDQEDEDQKGVVLENNNTAPEKFVLTAQAVLAMMQAVEDGGLRLSDFVPVGK